MQSQPPRSHEELVEACEFLENVLESSTQYSFIAKDLERRIMVWNKGAARIYGYDASEVIGQSSDMLHVPEEVRSGAVAQLHERARAEGHATGLFRRRGKDGSEFLARLTVTRRNDSRGNAIGYLVVSHDVTDEQRHVEEQQFLAEVGEALQASLDYAATVERIAQLAVGFMGDGCVIDVLAGSDKLSRKKVVHADPAKAGLAAALEHILPDRNHPIWRVLETKQPLLYSDVPSDLLGSIAKNEEHLRLLEGIGIGSVMLVPVIAHDRLVAVLTTVWCGPGRRYRPEDLGVAQEFARRAALALENAHLYDIAQAAIRTRDHILGVVAHDLRNPLSTIIMSTAVLRSGSEDRGFRRPVDAIERSATRMNRLIQDLLDVSRMEGGILTIEPAVVETRQAIADCLDAHKELAASASLELRLDLEEGLAEVWADRDRLLQVFENLIGNSIKFTAPGGWIVVGARSDGREVQFWVRDNGSGIASEDVPKLFDRFWQADNTGTWHRSWPAHRQGHRRSAWRPDLGREHERPGQYLFLHDSHAGRLAARLGGRVGPPTHTLCEPALVRRSMGGVVAAVILAGGCSSHSENQPQGQAAVPGSEHKNAEYVIEGQPIRLTDGMARADGAPGSASPIVTRYFGNELTTDLNDDGRQDVVFLLTQERGGSGTFFYAVAALNTTAGYLGSDGHLLGDRIAPQATVVSRKPRHKNVIVVNYRDRRPGEPMVAQPSDGKSVYLKLDAETRRWSIVAPD